MAGSIVVVGALTWCALFYCVCDLKAAQMDVKHISIVDRIEREGFLSKNEKFNFLMSIINSSLQH